MGLWQPDTTACHEVFIMILSCSTCFLSIAALWWPQTLNTAVDQEIRAQAESQGLGVKFCNPKYLQKGRDKIGERKKKKKKNWAEE